jgi:PAS domain S-box-containing protein
VTALKETQVRLVDTEESLAVTLASIEAGLVVLDRQGRVTRLNAVAEVMLGWSQAEALGVSAWEVMDRVDRPVWMRALNPVDHLVARGLTVDFPTSLLLRRRDGSQREVEAKAAPTYAADGSVRGATIVLRDLSAWRQSQINANLLAALVESSQDAIIGKTLDGSITSWNRAAENLFGYSAAEALGQHVQMLFPPDRLDEELRILADLARGMRVQPFDTERLTRAGHRIEVSVTISPIRDGQGRIIGASKIARDISPRRRAEASRLTAEQLSADNRQIQEASRLKSLFLANMSHELRTPLNAIIGFADLLRAGAVAPDSPKHGVFLGHIATSGRHLLQLINDVLDLSKVESGKFEFFPEALDLQQLVQEVGGVLRPALELKQQQLSLDIDPGLTDLVLDGGRLRQVLYNFLSNANKFTAAGGKLTVRARAEGALHFRIEVEDSGIGIPEADLPRLFIEFQQLDATYTKAHQGTGLGLALARRLVEAQGGTVGVRSQVGVGSVFHLVLRRQPEITPGFGSSPGGSGPLPPRRLLLIDPDNQTSSRMRSALAGAGYRVDTAGTAAQALQQVQQDRFDACALDLHPARPAGLSMLAALRSARRSLPPVVALTLSSGGSEAASFAIDNILAKPIRTEEVEAALHRFRVRPTLPLEAGAPVLVIDDDPQALELMRATLHGMGLPAVCRPDGRQALREIDALAPCAIVLDLLMPDFDGFAVLDALQALPRWRGTPVFIWTSLSLSEEEYAQLGRSARAILSKGGGALPVMLERLRHWLPPAAALAAEADAP